MTLNCTPNTIFNLSYDCSIGEDFDCFPIHLSQLNVVLGVWVIVIGGLCIIGNLFTLLAIPYASSRKKFDIHNQWPITNYILSLALADFLYCLIETPVAALILFHKKGCL